MTTKEFVREYLKRMPEDFICAAMDENGSWWMYLADVIAGDREWMVLNGDQEATKINLTGCDGEHWRDAKVTRGGLYKRGEIVAVSNSKGNPEKIRVFYQETFSGYMTYEELNVLGSPKFRTWSFCRSIKKESMDENN